MLACPTCNATYTDGRKFCLNDGTALVERAAPAAPAAPVTTTTAAAAAPTRTTPGPSPANQKSQQELAADLARAARARAGGVPAGSAPTAAARTVPPRTAPAKRTAAPAATRTPPAAARMAARNRPESTLPQDRNKQGRLKFSKFAIWGFVLVLLFWAGSTAAFPITVVGIVFAHIGRRAGTAGRRRGRGLATAALWIGYLSIPLSLTLWIASLNN